MIKKTHERIIKHVYEKLTFSEQNELSLKYLIKGSKHPDLYLPYRLMQHDYKGSIRLVKELINQVITKEMSTESRSMKLGIISHFVSDYACSFHSNPRYKYKHHLHRLYETRLNKYCEEIKFDINESSMILSLETLDNDLEFYLDYNQSKDVVANHKRDLYHAISLSYSIVKLVLEAYISSKAVQSSFINKQRIAIFSDTYFPHVNGVSNTLFQYLKYLKKTSQPYLLIIPKYRTLDWDKELGYHIHKVKSVRFLFYPSAMVPIPGKRSLTKVLDDFSPDVIHTFTEFNLGYFGLKYARRRDIPIISNYSTYFHLGVKHYRMQFVAKPLNTYLKWYHSKADLTTCPSEMTKEYLDNLGITPVKVFSRGVDRDRFSPAYRSDSLREEWNATKKVVFLFVSRISAEKDIYLLCQTYKYLPKKYRAMSELVVTGDGPLLAKLRNDFPEIIFTGQKTKEELAKVYASSDIFVFPSATETFGNVVLEAMASGLPCIVVNEGGVLATVKHMKNGIIIQPKEREQLQEAMITLLINKHIRDTLATNAILTAKKRVWDEIFERLIQNYQDLSSEKQFCQLYGDFSYIETSKTV